MRGRPFILGLAMGGMFLAMMHRPLMSGELSGTAAIMGFVGAHIALVAAIGSLMLLIPALRQRVWRHRPSAGHVVGMLGGMAMAIFSAHTVMHGVLV